MTTTFVEMYHPLIPSTSGDPRQVPTQAVDDYEARGWLLVDPEAVVPDSSLPYATVALVASQLGAGGTPIGDAARAAYATYLTLAANPDTIIAGTITRDSNGAATSAPVVWPDGSPGTYTADTVSSAFPGAVDAYHVTYGSPVTRTYTQAAVTRDANGAVTQRPALTVS